MLATRLAPMPFELATARLELGLWQESDAEWYQSLIADRGERPPALSVARAKVLELREESLRTGIGTLPIRRWQEGDTIGYCGLTIGRSTFEEPELVCELFRSVQGQGYATEAASVVLDAAVATGRRRVWATMPLWNAPSFRVVEKLGFEQHHSTWDDRGELVWYERGL